MAFHPFGNTHPRCGQVQGYRCFRGSVTGCLTTCSEDTAKCSRQSATCSVFHTTNLFMSKERKQACSGQDSCSSPAMLCVGKPRSEESPRLSREKVPGDVEPASVAGLAAKPGCRALAGDLQHPHRETRWSAGGTRGCLSLSEPHGVPKC